MVPAVPPDEQQRKTHGTKRLSQTNNKSRERRRNPRKRNACTSEFGVLLVSFLTPSAASARARCRRGRAGRLRLRPAAAWTWRCPRHHRAPPPRSRRRRRRGRRPAAGARPPSDSDTGSESWAPCLVVNLCLRMCLSPCPYGRIRPYTCAGERVTHCSCRLAAAIDGATPACLARDAAALTDVCFQLGVSLALVRLPGPDHHHIAIAASGTRQDGQRREVRGNRSIKAVTHGRQLLVEDRQVRRAGAVDCLAGCMR